LAQKIAGHFNANRQIFAEPIKRQEKPFEYKHVEYVERTSDIEEPAIAICTPGFGHAGASLSLLTEWAESEDCSVILTSGFLPVDSPLRTAKEKRVFRAEDGDMVPVRAEIDTIELSGHADQTELIELVRTVKPKRTLLVHGDLEQAEALFGAISEMTEVYIPEKGESVAV
jgi:Cft2 family RNA processing exonuclease